MESDGPGGGAPPERKDADDLRVTSLDGAGAGHASTRRAWRWGLRVGGLAALLALIAIAAVALGPLVPKPVRHVTPRPLDFITLKFPPDAGQCVLDGAWSPDGARIAIVRDKQCHDATGQPAPTLLIFTSATGALETTYPLTEGILSLTGGSNSAAPYTVQLMGVAWTPDGARIGVLFGTFAQTGGLASLGLALVTVRGPHTGASQIWASDKVVTVSANPAGQTGSQDIQEWDVQDGLQTALTLAPAYAYQWGAAGALTPLSGAAGKGTFSMWSSGRLWPVNALICDPAGEKFLARPYVSLTLSRVAWSPDGRYLVPVSVSGRYDTPSAGGRATPAPSVTPSTCETEPNPGQSPLAPTHDAGLRAAVALAASGGAVTIDLEWRPDGKRLAALTFTQGGSDSSILIYDCRTGALLDHVTAGQFPITAQPGIGPAKNFNVVFTGGAWSPDGRRLLVQTAGTGFDTFVLGPKSVGA